MKNRPFGERVIIIMNLKKLKRRDLAYELNISYNTLTKKLKGQRKFNYDELCIIKRFLELDNQYYAGMLFDEEFHIL